MVGRRKLYLFPILTMLQILKKIILVILLVIVIDKVFTFLFTNYIFTNTLSGESGGSINYVIQKVRNPDFLILGPSRAKHGIDPAQLTALGNGYNLGINGTTVLNSELVLDILIRNNVRPKTVILSADLSDYGEDKRSDMLDQLKKVYPYDTPLIKKYVQKLGYVEEAKYFFGLYRYNRKIANIGFNFLKRNTINNGNGYVGLPDMKDLPEHDYHPENFIYVKESTNAQALKHIQQICEENNIKLIVVFSPSYQNAYYNEAQQKLMIDDLKQEDITVIDLSNINTHPELNSKQYWRDALHFNASGAEAFSKILNTEIKNLLSRK